MLAEIRAGVTNQADGTVAPARSSRLGAMTVGDAQGRYYEAASRGSVFSAGLKASSGSIAAGNVILGTMTAATQFALTNPAGSGKNLSLLKLVAYAISGTAPIPSLFHCATQGVTAAHTVVATFGFFGANNVGLAPASVARLFSSQGGGALTGAAANTIIRAADLAIGAGVLVPANLMMPKAVEYIDGDIVIPPGWSWCPGWQSAAALLWGCSVTWEEIPV